MRIGIIGSSGGSVFKVIQEILRCQILEENYLYCVITDRSCAIEDVCQDSNIKYQRIEGVDNSTFSKHAKAIFDDFGGVDFVLLFYTRLITKELFLHYPTFNIHPSLLPAFRGFNPISQALTSGVKFLGATLHLINESKDEGPIVAQITMPLALDNTEKECNKFSFVQKVYLSLLLIDLMASKAIKLINNTEYIIKTKLPYTDRCNPAIKNGYLLQSILQLQENEKVKVV